MGKTQGTRSSSGGFEERKEMMSEREERARTTLRLPLLLAERVDEAAASERMVVNTWVVTAIQFALEHGALWDRWRDEQKRRAREARARDGG